jgi:hypothetical protein
MTTEKEMTWTPGKTAYVRDDRSLDVQDVTDAAPSLANDGVRHIASAGRDGVELANSEDGFYTQTFRTREELDAFISELVALRDYRFPAGAGQ